MFFRAGAGLVLAFLSIACEPELEVGTWCSPGSDQAPGNRSKVVDAPWSTGFELGFCDYVESGGYCYPSGSYTMVEAPVHGGRKAAAFSVTSDSDPLTRQSRCYREGALPREARYGAWYYVPAHADNTGDWNLMHFQGGDDLHHLWDVSMSSADDGSLHLYLFSGLPNDPFPAPPPAPNVPTDSWLHIEFRLLRAADTTGEVALYQDGALVQEITGIRTDDTDFAQWYVGNLVHRFPAQESTLYVDDVTIRALP